tara:strand:+ start:18437 stop:20182 length:1746 start_codon:yes stop_codon:yes gene_type:complete
MARQKRYLDPEINQESKPAPLIVARDPDYMSMSKSEPMMGNAGKLVTGGYDPITGDYIQGSVYRAGLDRKDFNIAYLVPTDAWNGEFFRHSWEDINDGLSALQNLIDKLQPSFIMSLGAHVSHALLPQWATLTDKFQGQYSGGKSIKSAKEAMDRRGFVWYPEEGTGLPCPIMPTLHPMTAYYSPVPERILMDIDFARMGSILRGELPRTHFPSFTRVYNEADLAPVWDSELVAYDIEITWGGTKFLCIAFYTAEGSAFLAYEDALRAVEPWLRSDRPKLAHNGQFDRYFLEAKMGIPVGGRHEDTIIGHWACYPELAGKSDTGGGAGENRKAKGRKMTRKGLNFLASFHLNYPWWKTYTSSAEMMGRLCVNDVVATMDAHKIITEDIDSFLVREQYERQLKKIPSLISVQKRGFRVDNKLRLDRIKVLEDRQHTLQSSSAEAAESFLKDNDHKVDPDTGKEYPWYHSGRCDCCNGASICKACNKVKDFKKSSLILWGMRQGMDLNGLKAMKVAEIKELLSTCEACEGMRKVDQWDFNPMSSTQLPVLLWKLLGIPKGLHGRSGPDASEDTIKKVYEWSKE